jgi:hypothetical protein
VRHETAHQPNFPRLPPRELQGVEALGGDEIHWGRGLRAANFLTVIYQIDGHCRRLLWVGQGRSETTLRRGLQALGPEVVKLCQERGNGRTSGFDTGSSGECRFISVKLGPLHASLRGRRVCQ